MVLRVGSGSSIGVTASAVLTSGHLAMGDGARGLADATAATIGISLAIGGATIGTNALAVTGTATISGKLTLGNGLVGTPSLTLGDATTGFYRGAADIINVAIGGVNSYAYGSTGLRVLDGLAGTSWSAAPGSTAANTRITRVSSGLISIDTTADNNGLGGLQAATVALGGATIGSNALAVTGLVNFGSAGSAIAPTLSVGNATTGFYSVSTTTFGISVNGVSKADFGNTPNQWTFANDMVVGQDLNATRNVRAGQTGSIYWLNRSSIQTPADGTINFSNNAATNSFNLSSPTATATPTLQLGALDAAVAVAQITRVQSVVAGTAAANGANWTLIGSLPTGTGTSGDIIFQTGVKTGSGTTQGTATTALTIKGETQAAVFTGAVTVPGVTTAALTSTGTFTSGAGAQVGTLTNSPVSGNPTSWIKIVDNGVTRYIPAW